MRDDYGIQEDAPFGIEAHRARRAAAERWGPSDHRRPGAPRFTHSTGSQALVGCDALVDKLGREFSIVSPTTDEVARVLELTGVEDLLQVFAAHRRPAGGHRACGALVARAHDKHQTQRRLAWLA
jgi:hypothetical protein